MVKSVGFLSFLHFSNRELPERYALEAKLPRGLLALKGHMGQVRQTKVSELSIYTKNKMFLQNRSSMHLGKKCCETYANSVFCCFEVWELSSQIIRLVQTKRRAPPKKLSKNPSKLIGTQRKAPKWGVSVHWDPGRNV